jgi:hypothetical protein
VLVAGAAGDERGRGGVEAEQETRRRGEMARVRRGGCGRNLYTPPPTVRSNGRR